MQPRLVEVKTMTALSTLVPALQRELAVPGTFETVFPDTTSADLTASLADGFSEAQLHGFFPNTTLTEDAGDWLTDPDLSQSGGALIVIFTSMRFIRAQLRATATGERYKAGPVEFELQRAATLLKAELDYLQKRLDDLIANAEAAVYPLAVVHDNYLARNREMFSYGGFYPYEYKAG